jgi:hypothetical protein
MAVLLCGVCFHTGTRFNAWRPERVREPNFARFPTPVGTKRCSDCQDIFCVSEMHLVYNATAGYCQYVWIPGLEPGHPTAWFREKVQNWASLCLGNAKQMMSLCCKPTRRVGSWVLGSPPHRSGPPPSWGPVGRVLNVYRYPTHR